MEQDELLKYALQVLEQLEIRYALVGSFASSVWGESRHTQDIDVVVDLQPAHVGQLCQKFPAPEFYVSEAAAAEAVLLRRPFNVIHPESANKIDFMVLPDLAWARAQIDRRRQVELSPTCLGYVAAPEDVILGKLVYHREGGSEKHLRDIAGILRMSGEAVDRAYIAKHAPPLGVQDIWQAILDKIG